jgi:zinc protease
MFMRHFLPTLLMAATSLVAPALLSPAAAQTQAAAPVSTLVKQVSIPHQSFTLKNGLRVIVHTDRKAPIVAVSVWYDVGSKHEPKGKTGFAHLFEHLMFNGSENAPGDFFAPLQAMGATDSNGTTWFDRTNYFQTVPKAALEKTLYLESDRMGYLLGAVTQEKLDNQRGVVQNEKRQGDTQPFGLVEYAQIKALVPEGHPYGHSTIGSMADLDAASMETVRDWFRQHYGPNNAVIVLAGDIDVKTAQPMMNRLFGAIPRGPQQKALNVPIPTLPAAKSEVMKDRVANTRLYRNWMVPGIDKPDSVPLDVAAAVLGGLASSRLDNILVRDEKLAVAVTAGNQAFAQLGQFEVTMDVRPGVDPAVAAKRLDEIIADFIKNGPTEDEVQRSLMRSVSSRIAGLEQVGGFTGKAVALAEGALYRNDSNFYKKQMEAMARVKPADVKAAMATWLTRPVYALTVEPGERPPYEEAKGGAAAAAAPAAAITPVKRPPAPEIAPIADLDFPDVTRTKLSNGVEIVYAQRTAVPRTQISLSLDAGHSADPRAKLGTQNLTVGLLDEGAAGMSSRQIAEAQERLGASIGNGISMDRTTMTLSALSANLKPSLNLFADVVLKPDFAESEVSRLRNQQLAAISAELKQPQGLGGRVMPGVLFGASHPYGVPSSGRGNADVVGKLTRDDLVSFHKAWVRPDKAKIFVVSDRPLAEVKTLLEARFGNWKGEGAAGTKPALTEAPKPQPRVILVNRPDSPQSLILGGLVLPLKGTDDLDTLITSNENLGGSFLARINMDLRETKGWSYGAFGGINRLADAVTYSINAPVQADKTGESIAAIMTNLKDFVGPKGTTQEEFERTISGSIRELPGSFELAGRVLGGMQNNDLFKRSDNYYETTASKYRAMTQKGLDDAMRAVLKPEQFIWVVVGDEKIVRPQLEKLGLPVEQGQVAGSN